MLQVGVKLAVVEAGQGGHTPVVEVVDDGAPLLPRRAKRVPVDTDDLLRGKMDVEIELAIENKETIIIIVGGSHSGISAICYLLEYFGDRIPEGLIHLYSRAEIMLWSRSVADILKASPQDIVDSRTGEVNRFAGVRASAKAMYLKICEGQDPRVVYHEGQFARNAIPEQISRAGKALFVNATGYQPRLPLMQNTSGAQVKLDQASGHACKQINTFALMSQGEAINGLYGIGLGYADRGESGFEVGINFFHGVGGGNLVDVIVSCEQRVVELI